MSANRTVFIGIGSNIGDRIDHCIESIDRVRSDGRVRFLTVSSFYLTSPVSEMAQDDFINGVMTVEWAQSPADLLLLLNSIENDMGRVRLAPGGPRIIDLDILLFGDTILSTRNLVIPHPQMDKRKFVLVPCLEIDSSLIHPVHRKPLSFFLKGTDETQTISLHVPSTRVSELLRQSAGHRGRAN